MAKAQPIRDLRAAEPLYESAAKVFAVRIDELWHWAAHLAWPERTRELHDMRIAAKRLRYCLEFYAPCFTADLAPLLAALKRLQDLAGEVHDYDVWVAQNREGDIGVTMDMGLAEELTQLRRERHAELLALWRELEAVGLRARLEEAVAGAGGGVAA